MGIEAPPELRRFARRVVARARRDNLLPDGAAWGIPRTGTEQWPFAAAGVPSLGVADQADEYMRTTYHTQHDRLGIVDPARLADGVRFYARLVIAADRNPGSVLDLAARPRELRRRGGLAAMRGCGVSTARLDTALDRYEAAAELPRTYEAGRAAFHAVARAVKGLSARDKQDLSYRQALVDAAALSAAARSLARGRAAAAVTALERVGRNALTPRLSEDVFAVDAARHRPEHPGITWAAPYQTPSPGLWKELAALRGEPGAPARGPWIAESVERARADALAETQVRVDRVADALERGAELLAGARP
jgi:hypothetical protein